MAQAVVKAFYDKLTSASLFSISVGGRVYELRGPVDADFQHAVYSLISVTHDRSFTKSSEVMEHLFQVDIFGRASQGTQAVDVTYQRLDELLNYAQIDPTGFDPCFIIPQTGSIRTVEGEYVRVRSEWVVRATR